MPTLLRRFVLSALCCTLIFLPDAAELRADGEKTIEPEKLEFFEAKIRPVLIEHCYECHSAKSKEVKGSLLVDSAQASYPRITANTATLTGANLVLQLNTPNGLYANQYTFNDVSY